MHSDALRAVAELAGRGALAEEWSDAAREAALRARRLKKGDWVEHGGHIAPIKGLAAQQGNLLMGSMKRRAPINAVRKVPKPQLKKVSPLKPVRPERSGSGESARHEVYVEGSHVADVVEWHSYSPVTSSTRILQGYERNKEWHAVPPGGEVVSGFSSRRPSTRLSAYTREEAAGEVLKKHVGVAGNSVPV